MILPREGEGALSLGTIKTRQEELGGGLYFSDFVINMGMDPDQSDRKESFLSLKPFLRTLKLV